MAPYRCERCSRTYPREGWIVVECWDEDHLIGSWYGCSTIRCPEGHEGHVDFSHGVYTSPNYRQQSAALGSVPPEHRLWELGRPSFRGSAARVISA